MHVEGDASGLFLHDRAVWVEVSHVDAAPVRIGNASAPSEPPTRANVSRRAAYGYLEATSADGHAPDQTAPSDAGNEPPSIISPPRRGDLWELSLLMSAFVPTGSLGVGALGSASVTYRFGPPFVVRAEVAPFGIAGPTLATTTTNPVPFGQTANPSTTIGPHAVTSAAAHLVVGLDTQFVELGLGAGGATVNQSPEFVQGGGQSPTGSVSMVEEGRLGARDGLAVIVESSLIATNQKFNIGYFVASFQIPLSRSVMLVARGGGGNVGFAYGDLGLRVLVRGDGGRKTLALTGFLGGAGVVENLCSSNPDPPFTTVCDNATLAGPSLGGGVEWRP